MFDLFGFKAKRYAKELAEQVDYLAEELHQSRMTSAKQFVQIDKLNEQLATVRMMANQMRDRVRSHGKTEAEQRFINVCLDIHKNGKLISGRRFVAAMFEIERDRAALEDAPGFDKGLGRDKSGEPYVSVSEQTGIKYTQSDLDRASLMGGGL